MEATSSPDWSSVTPTDERPLLPTRSLRTYPWGVRGGGRGGWRGGGGGRREEGRWGVGAGARLDCGAGGRDAD